MSMRWVSARRVSAALAACTLLAGLCTTVSAAAGPGGAGAAGAPVIPAAPTPAGVGGFNHVLIYNGEPHDFYWNQAANSLRHAWYGGGTWNTETLDGPGSTYPGATGHNVGTYSTAAIFAGQLHVWYEDLTSGALRHAWWNGQAWSFETLDGPGSTGGNGRTADTVGQYNTALLYNGLPHLWYYDSQAKTLRHAWWTGAAWLFETLDGPGTPAGNGRTGDFVGQYASSLLYLGQPHVWYRDGTFGVLRHGWWTGSAWQFEALDGPFAPGGNGRVGTDSVGSNTAVTLYLGQPHVWYSDEAAHTLRHAWYTGTAWFFETLDGLGGPNGRVAEHVGTDNAVTLYLGQPHVWYYDATAGTLRHAWWTGTTWSFESLDGAGVGGDNGRTSDDVGTDNTVTLFLGVPHVWYLDVHAHALRHAWWSGTTWFFETLDGTVITGPPAVLSLLPSAGPLAGGPVAVFGSGFTGATAVTIGGTSVPFQIFRDNLITITAPAVGAPATVDIRVTRDGVTSPIAAGDKFSYDPVPTVSSILPTGGPVAGGTAVTITGTGFADVVSVTFGGLAATAVHAASSTSITATTPAHAAGAVDVTVTTAGGSATLPGGYTYS